MGLISGFLGLESENEAKASFVTSLGDFHTLLDGWME